VLHYGWIPLIIYVGFTRSNPQPSLIKCVTFTSSALLLLTTSLGQVDQPPCINPLYISLMLASK
ncbi:hypothetical protein J132_06214, partial [Termitomyces sp. J132]